jgi:hypothetical protein
MKRCRIQRHACIRGLCEREKLCLAGIGDDGVLSVIANWIAGGRYKAADLFLEVGGLVSPSQEHVAWIKQSLFA